MTYYPHCRLPILRINYILLKQAGAFLLSLFLICAACAQELTASMQKVKLTFILDKKGTPAYSVSFDQKVIIRPSELGFIFTNDDAFNSNFKVTGSERKSVDETWKPVWGEVNEIRNHYEQVTIHLKQNITNRLLDIVFRVFADGVGFRYEFPQQHDLTYFIVTGELTQFNLSGNHKAFWIPGDYDTNEYPYTTSKISEIDNKALVDSSTAIAVRVAPDRYAVQTPLMLKSDDGLYINIHEAALINYPAMQLHVDGSTYKLTCSLVPDALGNKAYLHAPFHTPWRTIIVSDKAADILASKLILNLNDPPAITNTSWIKPMKFVGGIFKLRNYSSNASRRVHTTLAKQLALYITIYSPLQMAADLPENYEAHMDAFQFIKDVPVDWDDTKILAAEPGDYVAIARKEKGSNKWYIGAVTDENKRDIIADLSFLDNGQKYMATIYADADNASWQENPEAYTIKKMIVDKSTHLSLKLAAGGGAAVSLVPR